MERSSKREEKSESSLCLSSALLILRSGDNTRRMLREKLERKGFSKESVEYAIERVCAAGLINEERLFTRYAQYLAEKKCLGPIRVRQEIARRFDKEIVEMMIADALAEIDFSSIAQRVAEKQKNRDMDFTVRKLRRLGFYTEHIRYAVKMIRNNFTEEA